MFKVSGSMIKVWKFNQKMILNPEIKFNVLKYDF